MTDLILSDVIEHTPLLCESCLKLYPATQHHCPNCVDEPLLDISKAEVRQMLVEMDRQRRRTASHKYLSLSIAMLCIIYALVIGALALTVGKQLLLFLMNPVGLVVFLLSFAFLCLLSERLLMNYKPPKRIAVVWASTNKPLNIDTQEP